MTPVDRYTLEFYADAAGGRPILRWLPEELTPTQRRAIGVALREILEILRSLGKPARDEPQSERILLRVFCCAHGDRLAFVSDPIPAFVDSLERRSGSPAATPWRLSTRFQRRFSPRRRR